MSDIELDVYKMWVAKLFERIIEGDIDYAELVEDLKVEEDALDEVTKELAIVNAKVRRLELELIRAKFRLDNLIKVNDYHKLNQEREK